MKFSISNIALPEYQHFSELMSLRELGFEGLEVAPSRVWRDTLNEASNRSVDQYRREVEEAGLKVVGLHSLFFDRPELGLFLDKEYRTKTLDYLTHLSKVCRDLGGETLIYGGGRWHDNISDRAAITETISFLSDLIPRIESHGTTLCFEPLEKKYTNFINSVSESIDIVKLVGHSSVGVQIDAKELAISNELTPEAFEMAAPFLVHVHVNEPDLGVLGDSGAVDHLLISKLLNLINYQGYVSLEQKMLNKVFSMKPIQISAKIMSEFYL